MSRRLRAVSLVAAVLALASSGAAVAVPDGPRTARSADGVDTSRAIVQLAGEPLVTAPGVGRTAGGELDHAAVATRHVREQLAEQREEFRTWLARNAPEARVTGEFEVAFHGLSLDLGGTPIAALRSSPDVLAVGYENIYSPMDGGDPGLATIDALAGWAAAGAASTADPATWAGFGVQVAVIDSGIDVAHPCFDGSGYPITGITDRGNVARVTEKVVVSKVFGGSAASAASAGSHGTHVAGTIACELDTPAAVDGVTIPHAVSGVAPGAQLGDYNVFPGGTSARSETVLAALDEAAEDGMDVISLALAAPANGNRDLVGLAVDALDRSGIVVAVPAGNGGPGAFTIGSPGSASRALTAGATSLGHGMFVPVQAEDLGIAAVPGDFPLPEGPLEAELGVVWSGEDLGLACDARIMPDLEGRIALIGRGGCPFATKVSHAEEAGALGVLIVNDRPGAIPMAAPRGATIPAAMVGEEDLAALLRLDGRPVTLGALAHLDVGQGDTLLEFSSSGPTLVGHRVKPDLVAPGSGVLSAVPGGWDFRDGTSMAAAHVAGAAAVLVAARPGWEAWQVRSAIVNTAERGVVDHAANANANANADADGEDVLRVGAGLLDLGAAATATVALSSPSLSLGVLPASSGRIVTAELSVTNLGDSALTLVLEVEDSRGVGTFDVSAPTPLHLEPAASETVTVSFRAPRASPVGGTQAFLLVEDAQSGAEVAHAALFASLR